MGDHVEEKFVKEAEDIPDIPREELTDEDGKSEG